VVYFLVMLRSFVAALALALGVGGGGGTPPVETPPTPVPEGVLGIFWNEDRGGGELARLDPLTLKPVAPRLELVSANATADFSPDYGRLALVYPQPTIVQIVDVRALKSLGSFDLGIEGWVTYVAWERGSLFAVVEDERDGGGAVVTSDPVGRRVLERHRISGTILHAKRGASGQVVLLVAPSEGIGPLRLTVVGAKGMATTPIPGFAGGWESVQEGDDVQTRQRIPALVVDEVGERALVVSGRAVAEISLRNLAVRTHTLSQRVSLLGRLRDWLEPEAEAKAIEGPERAVRWVGDSLVAVSGRHDHVSPAVEASWTTPAGLALIDVRDWTVRRLDDRTTSFSFAHGMLLAYGATWDSRTQASVGMGLTAYGLDGKRRFHLFAEEPVSYVETAGPYAYVALAEGGEIPVVDLRSGRVVRTVARYKNAVPQLVKPRARF
jgi:hypothetical protein